MVVYIPYLSVAKLNLIYFKFSLRDSLIRIKHAKLDSLAAFCPNVEIIEHPKLIEEHRLDGLDYFQ